MKTATRYAADAAANMENAMRHMQPAPGLLRHSALPTTTQDITHYIEQLLTKDEQAVCDMATD
ncbi:MAG: hypothetical protein ACOYNL_09315 [Rickettsiales bacterium]